MFECDCMNLKVCECVIVKLSAKVCEFECEVCDCVNLNVKV